MSFTTGNIYDFFIFEERNWFWKLYIIQSTLTQLSFIIMNSSSTPWKKYFLISQSHWMINATIYFNNFHSIQNLNSSGECSFSTFFVKCTSKTPCFSILKQNQSKIFSYSDLTYRIIFWRRKYLWRWNFVNW